MSQPVYICSVCRRVLDRHTFTDGSPAEYHHTYQDFAAADHEPVPIPMPEGYTGGRCDFCNVDEVAFVVPARGFIVAPGLASDGDWAACSTCASLIERNRWNDLMARKLAVREVTGEVLLPIEQTLTASLWRKLRRHISGSIRPIEVPPE